MTTGKKKRSALLAKNAEQERRKCERNRNERRKLSQTRMPRKEEDSRCLGLKIEKAKEGLDYNRGELFGPLLARRAQATNPHKKKGSASSNV